MHCLPIILLTVVCSLTSSTSAATWYFLRYSPPSGQQFTSFSGNLKIPRLPKAGVYYLWPGLQPTDNSGVYQNVLDGRSGTWWIGSGWCCQNPSLPWGSGFNTYEGESVYFSNVKGSSSWTSTLKRSTNGKSISDSFALTSKTFNQAIFAIELNGVPWDFGPLQFTDVTITSTGTDSSWCTKVPENYNSATNYAIRGAKAIVNNDIVTCTFAAVTLQSPKK